MFPTFVSSINIVIFGKGSEIREVMFSIRHKSQKISFGMEEKQIIFQMSKNNSKLLLYSISKQEPKSTNQNFQIVLDLSSCRLI